MSNPIYECDICAREFTNDDGVICQECNTNDERMKRYKVVKARAEDLDKECKRYVQFLKTEQIKRKALKWERSALAAELEDVREELRELSDGSHEATSGGGAGKQHYHIQDNPALAHVHNVLEALLSRPPGALGKEIVEKARKWDEVCTNTPITNALHDEPLDRQIFMANNYNIMLAERNGVLTEALKTLKHRSHDLMMHDVLNVGDCWCSGIDGHSVPCLQAQAVLAEANQAPVELGKAGNKKE